MAGISMTGLGLPAATTTAAAAAGGVAPSAAQQAAFSDMAGLTEQELNTPDQSYPSLIRSHVGSLRLVGTPEAFIAQLAAQEPQAEYLERYIQGEIMQNPEGWDAYVGNPVGTARAGLQLVPGMTLPQPGTGTPGYLGDGSPVSGINVPGLSTPLLDPSTGEPRGAGGTATAVIGTVAVVGAGLLGWKFMKGRSAAADPARAVVQAFADGATSGAGAGAGALGQLQQMGRQLMSSGADVRDLGTFNRGLTLSTLGGGGAHGASTATAATAWGVLHGLAPGTGSVMANSAAAKFAGISDELAHKIHMDNEWMAVLHKLADNGGTLGDAATAGILSAQAVGAGAGGVASQSAAHLAGLRQVLAGVANSLPG